MRKGDGPVCGATLHYDGWEWVCSVHGPHPMHVGYARAANGATVYRGVRTWPNKVDVVIVFAALSAWACAYVFVGGLVDALTIRRRHR